MICYPRARETKISGRAKGVALFATPGAPRTPRTVQAIEPEPSSRHTHDGPLKVFYERIKQRRGSKVAKVAVAREILTLCYYGLRDGEIRRLEAAAARANSALALAPSGGPIG